MKHLLYTKICQTSKVWVHIKRCTWNPKGTSTLAAILKCSSHEKEFLETWNLLWEQFHGDNWFDSPSQGADHQTFQSTFMPGSKLVVLGMVISPLIGNPYNGYINPYYWVDDHPLLYGNNGSLDPSTFESAGHAPRETPHGFTPRYKTACVSSGVKGVVATDAWKLYHELRDMKPPGLAGSSLACSENGNHNLSIYPKSIMAEIFVLIQMGRHENPAKSVVSDISTVSFCGLCNHVFSHWGLRKHVASSNKIDVNRQEPCRFQNSKIDVGKFIKQNFRTSP